jgi:hypothetical protein
MENQVTQDRPRAFYPDFAKGYTGPGTTPGWDLNGPERRMDDGRTLARAMGWMSFGLGAVELAAPKRVARFLGVDERHSTLIRGMGLREVASGAGIMKQRTPAAGAWSRVAGDVLDLALLTAALGPSRRRDRVLTAMGVVAGALALDALAAKKLTQRKAGEEHDGARGRRRSFQQEGMLYHEARRSTTQQSDRAMGTQREAAELGEGALNYGGSDYDSGMFRGGER